MGLHRQTGVWQVDSSAQHSFWRRNLYVLWVGETLTVFGFAMCFPFLPFYLADLGATSFESRALWSGAMIASSAGFAAISTPLWGMASDRFGRKNMVVRAMFCGTITTGLMGLVTSPWQLLGLFILDGALSGTVAAAMTLVAVTTPKERLGYALGFLQTAIFVGISVGPMLGGVLGDQIGYRAVFGVGSAMLLIATILTAVLTREHFVRDPQPEIDGSQPAPNLKMTAILLAGAIPALIGIMFALRLATGALIPIMPLFVEKLVSAGSPISSLAGLTFGVSGIGSAISALVLGRASDRVGHRLMLTISGLAVAVLFIPLAIVQSPWQLIVCYGLLGIATGGIIPSANALVTNLTPLSRRGTVFGVTNAAASLGGFFGPFGGSLLVARTDIRIVFIILGVIMCGFAVWLASALRSMPIEVASRVDANESQSVPLG